MARIVVIFSLCLAACDVGELPGATGDGGGGGDVAAACEPIAMPAPAGHHVPPMTATGCMSTAGCHSQTLGLGTNAPAYSYGGMLYKADKVTPYGGATIVVEMGGALKKAVVADNGEFYLQPGVAGLDPPTMATAATTWASGCPTVKQPMVTTLKALADGTHDGDCSRSTCHTANGGQGPIFLQ